MTKQDIKLNWKSSSGKQIAKMLLSYWDLPDNYDILKTAEKIFKTELTDLKLPLDYN